MRNFHGCNGHKPLHQTEKTPNIQVEHICPNIFHVEASCDLLLQFL